MVKIGAEINKIENIEKKQRKINKTKNWFFKKKKFNKIEKPLSLIRKQEDSNY